MCCRSVCVVTLKCECYFQLGVPTSILSKSMPIGISHRVYILTTAGVESNLVYI